jgi:PAS domain S-box-containing protein
MVTGLRKTGIDVVGFRPWGTHVCQFYETKEDLLDTLVPYFKAGLASNEHCVWVIANPLTETEARVALGEAVPALDRHFAERSIEIVLAQGWSFEDDTFDPAIVMKRWNEKLADALGRGYDGLRVAGHLSWVSATQRKAVSDYEKALDASVSNQPMIVLCTYPVRITGAVEILAVARTHHVSLARRHTQWEMFEPSTVNPPKEEIRGLNEDQLRKSEERWRAVFDNSAVGIVLQTGDRSGRFVAANAAYQRMLGYSEDELRALTFVDITYDEDREANRRLAAELLEGKRESFTLTKRNRRKDGSLMWVSIHVSLIPGTGSAGTLFMSIVDDITERKHAEEALGRSERQFRALFEEAPVGIALVDAHGRPFESNQKLQQMLGYGADELRRTPFTAFTHPDDAAADWLLFTDVLNRRRHQYHLEKRYVRKDGGLVWGDLTVYVARDDRGEPMFTIGIVEDITERKRAEESLRQAQAELAHVTRVTTLGELAASIAHEVNQPLAAIVADANASLNWLASARPDLEPVREALQAIVTDGHRAAEVIQRIRQLAKKGAPQKTRLDINGVIRDIAPLVRAELLKHQVSLRWQLLPEPPSVLGDRVQLQQVLINLVMNAIEAMAPVTDRPRDLVIRSELHDRDHVGVAVQDTGVGIDRNHLVQVFDAFFTTKSSGMGMGLSISRSIVEAHGGRLWAGSNVGPGATFQFSLPTATTGES